MSARRKLFYSREPYDLDKTNELFAQAMKENCAFHYSHCEEYRKVLDHFKFSPEDVKTYEDIFKIPVLPTAVFKNHHMFSMSEGRILAKATSSGTKGKFSKIGFETSGLLCALVMVLKVVRCRKLLSAKPCNYIMMGYQPHKSNQTAGLICEPKKRNELVELLACSGVVRIMRAGNMSESYCGEAHDGEYPLRRYTRIVNVEL